MAEPIRVAITTGDTDGIGLEVSIKALTRLGPQEDVQFYLWRSQQPTSLFKNGFENIFQRQEFSDLTEALKATTEQTTIFDLVSTESPVSWVESTADLALREKIDAMVTAPISKTLISDFGRSEIGHTELIQSLHKDKNDLFMVFLGANFNVLLVTGHIPLEKIKQELTIDKILQAVRAAKSAVVSDKPIALVGLNPHSGEQGLIGTEEQDILIPALDLLRTEGFHIEGPLVPDAAFSKENWKKFSIFVCPYHDQGLIPFKMIHGHEGGVHLTSGIDFIRTSVDHGTAKDLFNKNLANANSMFDAIKKAIELAKIKRGKNELG